MAVPAPGMLRGISLCAGVGGLDLGLHIAFGHGGFPRYRTVCFVERDANAAATLVARMEDAALDRAPIWDDLASFDGAAWRGCVDIVVAGYPCQPFSQAGRRKGAEDPRHLWPHVHRIIGQCAPGIVFLENVAGHLTLGYRDVRSALETLGYRVAEGLFTAAEVGASHRRERLFILAYDDRHRQPRARLHDGWGNRAATADDCRRGAALADADSVRFCNPAVAAPAGADQRPAVAGSSGTPVSADDDALPLFPPGPADDTGWVEYLTSRPALIPVLRRGHDGLAGRLDRSRACGNGVVPLVAAHAFRTLAAQLGLRF